MNLKLASLVPVWSENFGERFLKQELLNHLLLYCEEQYSSVCLFSKHALDLAGCITKQPPLRGFGRMPMTKELKGGLEK